MLIEAFVQDIKVQLHMTSEEVSSSGSVGSIKATVMSLSKSMEKLVEFEKTVLPLKHLVTVFSAQ